MKTVMREYLIYTVIFLYNLLYFKMKIIMHKCFKMYVFNVIINFKLI